MKLFEKADGFLDDALIQHLNRVNLYILFLLLDQTLSGFFTKKFISTRYTQRSS